MLNIVYGPMALAATRSSTRRQQFLTLPSGRIDERIRRSTFFQTSPTAIRMLRKSGGDAPKNYNYPSST